MVLLDDFFVIDTAWQGNIDDAENGMYVRKVRFNADHFIFKAHFPDSPVTPGVCLVQMATEILEQILQKPITLKSASSIKFRLPLTPEKTPVFCFSKLRIEDGILSARVGVEDGYAVMRLSFNA